MYMHVKEGANPLSNSQQNSSINKESPPNKESPRNCLNANIRKANRVITSLYADALDVSELQGTQFTLLSAISGMGEATIGGLSNFLVMDQTTVTRSVNLLKKANYVEVVKGEDRRQRIIALTTEGKKILKSSYPLWLEAQTDLWEKLGDEKATLLLELTQTLSKLYQDV